jgi:hypothetical protein
MTQLVLELAQQDLLRLPRAQPGDPLQLADVVALCGLQLLANVVEVALAVYKRTLALVECLGLDRQRLLLCP